MLYNEETITQAIHTKWAGKTVHFLKETDSTNIWAKTLARDGAPHGALAVTEFQSAGRGRFNRKWTASEGTSVMMTLVLRPQFGPLYASMLTLIMGLSVAQAAEKFGFLPSIKWPNDVVLSRKKICGILTEMSADVDKINFVVIGVGINVNTQSFPEEVADKATSFYAESGQRFDRNQVVAAVMEAFEKNYEKFEKTCNLTELKEDYERLLANLNQPVRVLDSHAPYEGICRGITGTGELLVETEDGIVKEVGAGEVSVRGLYSYV